jgi:hypothetical protein
VLEGYGQGEGGINHYPLCHRLELTDTFKVYIVEFSLQSHGYIIKFVVCLKLSLNLGCGGNADNLLLCVGT